MSRLRFWYINSWQQYSLASVHLHYAGGLKQIALEAINRGEPWETRMDCVWDILWDSAIEKSSATLGPQLHDTQTYTSAGLLHLFKLACTDTSTYHIHGDTRLSVFICLIYKSLNNFTLNQITFSYINMCILNNFSIHSNYSFIVVQRVFLAHFIEAWLITMPDDALAQDYGNSIFNALELP